GAIAQAVGLAVRGAVPAGQGAPDGAAWLARAPLEAWGETWQALARLQEETEFAALDRRQAVLSSLDLLSQTMQNGA
ncbi:MAG: hypothetical protein KGL12_01185, partial [Rhodospirillales bacterium]|nr:hypothetical protein [Rhodospirillales bacterium]